MEKYIRQLMSIQHNMCMNPMPDVKDLAISFDTWNPHLNAMNWKIVFNNNNKVIFIDRFSMDIKTMRLTHLFMHNYSALELHFLFSKFFQTIFHWKTVNWTKTKPTHSV